MRRQQPQRSKVLSIRLILQVFERVVLAVPPWYGSHASIPHPCSTNTSDHGSTCHDVRCHDKQTQPVLLYVQYFLGRIL